MKLDYARWSYHVYHAVQSVTLLLRLHPLLRYFWGSIPLYIVTKKFIVLVIHHTFFFNLLWSNLLQLVKQNNIKNSSFYEEQKIKDFIPCWRGWSPGYARGWSLKHGVTTQNIFHSSNLKNLRHELTKETLRRKGEFLAFFMKQQFPAKSKYFWQNYEERERNDSKLFKFWQVWSFVKA